jgi:hypothetical protein
LKCWRRLRTHFKDHVERRLGCTAEALETGLSRDLPQPTLAGLRAEPKGDFLRQGSGRYRVHMAKVTKAEGDSRRGPMYCLCEGWRDGNPRPPFRRGEDGARVPILAREMSPRSRRQADGPPLVPLADDFKRTGALVERRPLRPNKLRLPASGQPSRYCQRSKVRRASSENSLDRAFVRQHNRVAPFARSPCCVERRIAFAPADRLRIGQHLRGHCQLKQTRSRRST